MKVPPKSALVPFGDTPTGVSAPRRGDPAPPQAPDSAPADSLAPDLRPNVRRSALGRALAATSRPARVLMATSAALCFLERTVLVVAASSLVAARTERTAVVAGLLASVYVVHGALRATTRHRIYVGLVAATVRALLRRRALGDDEALAADEQQTIFEAFFPGEQLLSHHLPDVVGNGAAVLALLVVLPRVGSPGLLATGVLAVVLAAGLSAFVRRLVTRAELRSRETFVPVIDAIVAAVRGRVELVASGRSEAFAATCDARIDAWRRASAHGDRIAAVAARIPLIALGAAVGVFVLASRMTADAATLASLGSAALIASALPAFAGTAKAFVDAARATARFAPLAAILAAPPRDEPRDARPLPELPVAITVTDLGFAYPGATRSVLEGLSFAWGPNATMAITGPNGSGKSTLLRVLLGLARPSTGKVRIGDVDLAAMDAVAWRRSIGYLAQRPYFPDRATIREAVTLFGLEASDARIIRALERVEVLPALRAASPDDPLGARIGALSIGQRQRVAIARVLCEDAPILLLDEPDANLDAAGIRLVADLVTELAPRTMILVVAHTPEIVARASTVLTLAPRAST